MNVFETIAGMPNFSEFRLTDEEMASLTPEQHEWVLSVQDKDDYELFGCID